MTKKTLLLILLLTVIQACVSIRSGITHLRNGLEIVIKDIPNSQVIALNAWVKTGSRNENEQNNGITHFMEHLLFKGTELHKAGELERIIEGSGGIFNAATSYDYTQFYIVLPRKDFKTALEILSDSLANPVFDPKEIEKERQVVLEEISRRKDHPGSILFENLYLNSYKKHPYKRKVIGTEENIRNIKRDTIVKYYQDRYTSQNMLIIAAGDFKGMNAAAELKRVFSKFPKRKKDAENISEEVAVKENKQVTKYMDINREYLGIAFAAPKASDRDSLVMDLISTVLGTGRTSRFNREIREKGFVSGISTYYPTPKDPGLFIVSATCDPKKSQKALKKIVYEINRLKNEEISESELTRALNIIESDYLISHETPQGAANSIGFFAAVADIDYDTQYLKRIKEIKTSDVKRVANKYFDRQVVVFLNPKI